MTDTPATERPVLSAVRNRIGHLTLNRPAGLNALTLDMIRQLHGQLAEWAEDPAIHAVVLRANGEKAFCAGGDIRFLYDSFKAGDTAHETFFEEEYALDHYIHTYPKPVLALMDGFVLGGGMGLVQGATLRVITERARMGMPEVGIGYFPDVGGSYFLSRLPGELGTYLGVTGVHIDAADALYAGLADHCITHDQLTELDRCLDGMSWSVHPEEALRTLVSSLAVGRPATAELEALRPAIDAHFAHADVHAIRAALADEQRPAYRDWAQATLKVMDGRSPLAMCVTRELLHRGRLLDLPACFGLELHLDRQWFAQGDIMEGVRALIVHKDKNPHWNPPSLDAVDADRVAAFFAGFKPAAARSRRLVTA
ncbi:enoyl-CoA hydratase/isomerase family protein [Stutzerimonas urumqiensis]|uniref:enoyl-CoA hydratase/isomerase family protein n=1 Tax=Stutzerimonas urumqiensis TaxID=638269 RepID=UPI003DA281B9